MVEQTGKRILVMEDEKAMARAMELKLSRVGFEVQSAQDGEEGMKALQEGKFDLILLDLVMPKLNGFAVLQEIRNRGISSPVIVLSNLSQEEDAKRAKELGAQEFFVKSDTPIAKIIERVSEILA